MDYEQCNSIPLPQDQDQQQYRQDNLVLQAQDQQVQLQPHQVAHQQLLQNYYSPVSETGVHQTPTQTPILDFQLGQPLPDSSWDVSLAQSFDEGQFSAEAAMATYVQRMPNTQQIQQRVRRENVSLLPPIATLESVDAQGRVYGTPASTPSSMSAATPTATPSMVSLSVDAGMQDAQEQGEDQQPSTVQKYQSPQVIQLVERPLRRIRTRTQTNQKVSQKQKQAQAKALVQAQQREAYAQKQAASQAASSHGSPASVTQSPVDQYQVRTPAPSLVTSVPSPGQWYGIHALPASQMRVNASGPGRAKSTAIGDQPQTETARAKARQAAQPYPRQRQRRTVSGPAVLSATSRTNEMPAPSQVSSPSTSLPARSPLSTTSPLSVRGPALSAPPELVRAPRYLVRTDVHYDASTNTLTAMLEIPGVPRAAIRVAVGDDGRSGTRMLVVRGRMRRVAFPPQTMPAKGKATEGGKGGNEENGEGERAGGNDDAGYLVKERKCGEFKRVLVVPPETKPEHVEVSMADGILFLRYPAGEQSVLFTQVAACQANRMPTKSQMVHSQSQALANSQSHINGQARDSSSMPNSNAGTDAN